ncbi:MAG TPA: GNAT family N-acetyltransferase [Steroidobacteraceae bacterium]
MEIRNATINDIDALVELGEMMHAESPRYRTLTYDPVKVAGIAQHLICDPAAQVLVAEQGGQLVGMLAGMVVQHYFGHDYYATDYVFFVRPEHRGSSAAPRLYRAWEELLKADGRAKEIALGISTEVDLERTWSFYKRLGFHGSGAIMVKKLEGANHV